MIAAFRKPQAGDQLVDLLFQRDAGRIGGRSGDDEARPVSARASSAEKAKPFSHMGTGWARADEPDHRAIDGKPGRDAGM
jgi:hypothetical protein